MFSRLYLLLFFKGLLCCRYCTSFTDEVICVIRGCEFHECLSCRAEFGCTVGYHQEWTLNLVATVLDVLFGAFYTANGEGFDAFLTFYCGQRSVTDCAWVALNSLDDCAGGGQFLGEFAGICGAGNRFKTISGAGACFTSDASNFTCIAADCAPVSCTGKQLCNLFYAQVVNRVFCTVVPFRPALLSSSFKAREERPMSAEPLDAASMPVPEPVGS